MLYELRLYQPHAGRLPDLLARFRDHIPALFARHSIRCLGQWVIEGASEGKSARFAYLMAYDDFAHRDVAWTGFAADPEWHAVRRQSNGASEMLRGYDLYFLRPKSSFAPPGGALSTQGTYELLFLHSAHGQDAVVCDWLFNVGSPVLHAAGAAAVSGFDLIAGANLPQSVLLVHWLEGLPPGGAARILHAAGIRSEIAPTSADFPSLQLRPAQF